MVFTWLVWRDDILLDRMLRCRKQPHTPRSRSLLTWLGPYLAGIGGVVIYMPAV